MSTRSQRASPAKSAPIRTRRPLPGASDNGEKLCRQLFCANNITDRDEYAKRMPSLRHQKYYDDLVRCGDVVYQDAQLKQLRSEDFEDARKYGLAPRRIPGARVRRNDEFCVADNMKEYEQLSTEDKKKLSGKLGIEEWSLGGNWEDLCTKDYLEKRGLRSFSDYRSMKRAGRSDELLDRCAGKIPEWATGMAEYQKELAELESKKETLQVFSKDVANSLKKLDGLFLGLTKEFNDLILQNEEYKLDANQWVRDNNIKKYIGDQRRYLLKQDEDALKQLLKKVTEVEVTAYDLLKQLREASEVKSVSSEYRSAVDEMSKKLLQKLSGSNEKLKLEAAHKKRKVSKKATTKKAKAAKRPVRKARASKTGIASPSSPRSRRSRRSPRSPRSPRSRR